MCGIVGYHGFRNPRDVILDGLKCLEYRGYDSAGVAIFHDGIVRRVRAEGKLSNLESQIKDMRFDGQTGIGHTRWATHGEPSERNAHPHTVSGVSIVHNGIIENYLEIRNHLKKIGRNIVSDTDSELVAHLIAIEIEKTNNLFKAVTNVLPALRGAYSIVAIWENHPDEIVAFKNGPPLLLGVGEKELIVASDLQAIIPYTKNILYLDDNEIINIKGTSYSLHDSTGKLISKKLVEVNWTNERAKKQGFKHFMLKEIFEQPRTIASAVRPHIDLNNLSTDFKMPDLKEIERIVIVACGTSYYTGLIAEYYFEKIAKIPTEVELASEFRYREPILLKKTLMLFISQSGETADTVAALKKVKELDVTTMSLCNVPLSTIDRETQIHLYMNCESEVGVASTKAFTASLALLNLLSLYLAKLKSKLSTDEERKHIRQLIDIPSQMEKVLSYNTFFKDEAEKLKNYKGFLFIGRGVSYPISLEGALKLKELAYMHAEGYAAGEMKHGPIALIDKSMCVVAVAPNDDLFEKTISNVEEICARGGSVISIGTGQNEKLKHLSQSYISIPETHWSLTPILSVISVQLLAYHLSDSLGHDVDQPRNLAKSVTVE